MPTLKNKPPKRKGFSFTPNPVYRTSTWKRTRDSYIKVHPRCEVIENGKVCGKPGFQRGPQTSGQTWREFNRLG